MEILSILLFLGFLACWIMVLIPLFKENVGLGILGIICGLFAFIWGWIKAKEKGLTKVMIIWTIIWILLIILNLFTMGSMLQNM
ncbi:hypothetical protein JXJ21_10000 [candidate division KSB1 bacterium]|nr:hypothetical protein [candidate division KSB1 bacterium]